VVLWLVEHHAEIMEGKWYTPLNIDKPPLLWGFLQCYIIPFSHLIDLSTAAAATSNLFQRKDSERCRKSCVLIFSEVHPSLSVFEKKKKTA